MSGKHSSNLTWQDVASEAQQHRDSTIADKIIQPPIPDIPERLPLDVTQIPRQLLTANEVHITELPPEQLLAKLAAGSFTATEVIQAYLRRAGIAQKLVNCVTELLPERALRRAAQLDVQYKSGGGTVGPLHGLPISVKEHISMEGLDLNFGYVALRGRTSNEEAHPLQILYAAGAILYVRTTEPQTVMHLETSSNLYGITVNPFNRNLSAGGSSGGEGALLALRGSCLGIGTDIGGSIRSPAGNCGVYGLRPTAHRLPYQGVEATVVGTGGIVPTQGPLSTSLEGIRLYMKTMLDTRPWESEISLVPIPWRVYPAPKRGDKLKIGVMWHDDVVQPHPPITRALKQVTGKLKTVDGVEIFDFKAYDHQQGWNIISSLYFADGAKSEYDVLGQSGEPLRPLTKWLLEEDGHVRRLTAEELWKWQTDREQYQQRYNREWTKTSTTESPGVMDILLCPYFPSAGSLLDTAKYWPYTSTWNLLDYPALVFPVTRVDPDLDKFEEIFKPLSDKDLYNHQLYDPETFAGAPVSLQLVTRRFEDEKLVGIAEYLVEELGLPWAKFI